MKHLKLLGLTLLLTFGAGLSAYAQDSVHLIYVANGDVIVSGDKTIVDGEPFDPIYTMPNKPTYVRPVVAPDQSKVFFKNRFDDVLYATSFQGGDMANFTDLELALGFQVTFSPDGKRVLIPTQSADKTSGEIDLWSASLNGSELKKLGTLSIEIGCGGGPQLPDDSAYSMQSGPLLLVWPSNDLILASMSCLGTGVQKLTLSSGQVMVLDKAMSRVKLSSDGTLLAGIVDNKLRRMNLVGDDIQDYAQDDGSQIDRVAWLPDGRLIFSTVAQRGQIPLKPEDAQLASDTLYGLTPENVPLYTTSLYLLGDGSTTELWHMSGWRGLPVITASADTVYFSAIPDMETMVNTLNSGKDFMAVVAARPTSSIYKSSLSGDTAPVLLFKDGEFPTQIQ